MKAICIKHPLRNIVYTIEENDFQGLLEVNALANYRQSHDEVWAMKIQLEKDRGDILLTQIKLDLLVDERKELERIHDFYTGQVDRSQADLLVNIDIKLQVEIRDFTNQVTKLHHDTIVFYDDIQRNSEHYNRHTDNYYRDRNVVDPLNFKVLDDVFQFHEDMMVDISSLDKDLQEFLSKLKEVHILFDDYVAQYTQLYTSYSYAIQHMAALTKEVKVWDCFWKAPNL